MRQIRWTFGMALVFLVSAVPAAAQSNNSPSWWSAVSGLWTVSVGANVVGRPAFEGAKDDSFSVAPIINVSRAGSASERFTSPRDSASIALFDYEGFSAGPAGKLKSARKSDDRTELTGLGDVGTTVELGGFVQYFPFDWFRTRIELRRGFGGHTGVVADFSADAIVPVWQRLTLSGGPRFALENSQATAPYFSVDSAQALASGLSAFDAKGGAHSAGAGAQLRYQINAKWETHGYVEYDRLLGDAGASPLVTQRGAPNQVAFGLGASYAFELRVP
jgi:MipA family protein